MTAASKHNENPIYYLGHNNAPAVTGEERVVSLAAVTKMDYIADVLNRIGRSVHFISMAGPVRGSDSKGGTFALSDSTSLTLWSARPKGGKFNGLINYIQLRRKTEEFLASLSPKDVVVCYHSLEFCELLPRAKRRAGFRLILEVEELYSDVTGRASDLDRERKSFEAADAFIFPTRLLAEKVGASGRPYALCSGIYGIAQHLAEKRGDGLVHVVYAGTLDPRKGGAAAAAAGAFLDANYAMHILGGGSDLQVDAIRGAVEEANGSSRGCNITYEGLKSGREFDEFVQSCHIGLSPQNPSAEFNTTSFPSKVFMYLSNGLKVVSVDLPVFEGGIRDALTLCPSNSPEDLAHAIRSAAAEEGASPHCLLERLDAGFRHDLAHLFAMVRKGSVE